MTGRSVEEWRGKTPDSMPPISVRLRIFNAYGGRCYRSGRKITASDKWALDHVLALGLGGANVESNLAPILVDKHKEKTAEDIASMRKADRVRAKHLGLKAPSKRKIPAHVNPWGTR